MNLTEKYKKEALTDRKNDYSKEWRSLKIQQYLKIKVALNGIPYVKKIHIHTDSVQVEKGGRRLWGELIFDDKGELEKICMFGKKRFSAEETECLNSVIIETLSKLLKHGYLEIE